MPLDKHHAQLEKEVAEYLTQRGWVVPPALTYHEHFDVSSKRLLSSLTDATSLCIRTRADRIAINSAGKFSVKFEPKTVQNGHYNFVCELSPLMIHMAEAEMGIKCVYPIKRLRDGLERCLIVSPLIDAVTKICIPAVESQQVSGELIRFMRSRSSRLFPNAEIIVNTCSGSGDPYALISWKSFEELPDWRLVFDSMAAVDSHGSIPCCRI